MLAGTTTPNTTQDVHEYCLYYNTNVIKLNLNHSVIMIIILVIINCFLVVVVQIIKIVDLCNFSQYIGSNQDK